MTEPVCRLALESPRQDAVIRLLDALDAYQSALYPAESNHFLDVDSLAGPDVRFFVARLDGEAVGCGALRIYHHTERGGYGELKRMYVAPATRGTGLGRRLVAALEAEARRLGVRRLVLETGVRQAAALALYRATGFRPIPLYGEYCLSPETSVCMGKEILGDPPMT